MVLHGGYWGAVAICFLYIFSGGYYYDSFEMPCKLLKVTHHIDTVCAEVGNFLPDTINNDIHLDAVSAISIFTSYGGSSVQNSKQ